MVFAARLFLFVGFLIAPMLCSVDIAQAQIVAIGASNVAGRGVSSSDAWPAQLEGMLAAKGRNVHVTNAGISGDTNAGMLARLDSASLRGQRSCCSIAAAAVGTRGDAVWGTRMWNWPRSKRGFAVEASE